MIDLWVGGGVPMGTNDVFCKSVMDPMLYCLDIGGWGVVVRYVPRW